jgi:hypothetical protein
VDFVAQPPVHEHLDGNATSVSASMLIPSRDEAQAIATEHVVVTAGIASPTVQDVREIGLDALGVVFLVVHRIELAGY